MVKGMLENENQTKVHFKMYKDGKRWVTRGLALFAVSLMVGGPVMGTVAHVQEAAYAASKTDARNTISSDTLLREAINGDQTLMSDVKKVITAYNGLNVDHAEMETLTFGDFLKLYAYGATQDNLLSKTEKEKMVDLANHLLSLEQAKEQLENAISLGRSN